MMYKIVDNELVELTPAEEAELERYAEEEAEKEKYRDATAEDYEAALERLGVVV